MDCQKDFKGQEYDGHTKCISEAEKYSDKNYVPKPSQNKGQRKQEAWIDIIQSVLDRNDLAPAVRNVVNLLTKHENVPRKRPKFINFMKNISRQTSPKDTNRVFDLIEEAFKSAKGEEEPPTNPENGEDKSLKRKAEENGTSDSQETNGEEPKPKKKKEVSGQNGKEDEKPIESNGIAKKKKDKTIAEEETNGQTSDLIPDEVKPANVKKSKRKKKNKPKDVPLLEANDVGSIPFQWKETIRSLLTEKSNSMKLEKLKKKVLKSYRSQAEVQAEEINEETIDVVLKRKLKKMKNINIENDRVVLTAA